MSVQIFTVPTLVSGNAILLPTFDFHGKGAKYAFASKLIYSTEDCSSYILQVRALRF